MCNVPVRNCCRSRAKWCVPSEATSNLLFTANDVSRLLSPAEVTQVGTEVCVPPRGFADIRIRSQGDTVITLGVPLDPTSVGVPRRVAVRLADLSLGPPAGRC